MSMIDETITELSSGIAKAHDALKRELAKLRTGRANPALLLRIRASMTPDKQLEIRGSTRPLRFNSISS